jgi:hypothetical protein
MPLAMNYEPKYPFPFEPGTHYHKIDKPEDLLTLKSVNPIRYGNQSRILWNNYFRPDKAVDLLMSM